MRKVYIVDGKRTAIGKFLGSLSTVKPGDMTAQVMKHVIAETGLDAAKIDEVFVAHQHSAGQGPSISRRAQLEAGIPSEIPATTINMQCGSGLKSTILAYYSIQAGNQYRSSRRRGKHVTGPLYFNKQGPQGCKNGEHLGGCTGFSLL